MKSSAIILGVVVSGAINFAGGAMVYYGLIGTGILSLASFIIAPIAAILVYDAINKEKRSKK